MTGLVLLVLSAWRGGLTTVAGWFGVATYPPAILFAVATLFIIAVLLHYSTVLSALSDNNTLLAQRIALLEQRVDEASGRSDDPGRGVAACRHRPGRSTEAASRAEAPSSASRTRPRVAFVYANSRRRLAAEVAAGTAPGQHAAGPEPPRGVRVRRIRARATHQGRGRGRRARPPGAVEPARDRRPWELGRRGHHRHAAVQPAARRQRGCAVVPNRGARLRARHRPRSSARRGKPAPAPDVAAQRRPRSSASATSSGRGSSSGSIIDPIACTPCFSASMRVPQAGHGSPGGTARGYVLAVGKDLARDYRTLAEAAREVDAPVRDRDRGTQRSRDRATVECRGAASVSATPSCATLYEQAALRRAPAAPDSGIRTARRAVVSPRSSRRWRWRGRSSVSDRPVVREYVEADESALGRASGRPRRARRGNPRDALGRPARDTGRCGGTPRRGGAPYDAAVRAGPGRGLRSYCPRPPASIGSPRRTIHGDVREIPFRRLVSGPPAPDDRIALLSLWFHGHNNPRYAELLPRLERLDACLLRLPDRRVPRGIGYRLFRAGHRPVYGVGLGRAASAVPLLAHPGLRAARLRGPGRPCSTPTTRTSPSMRSS